MKDYSLRNEKSRLIQAMAISLHEIITELFDNGYDQGYADAKSELGENAIDLAHEESNRAYQQGLEDAWETARKITLDNGLSIDEVGQIFGTVSLCRILKENTASEAIAKIKEYEEKQKQDAIQVGDEVTTRFGKKGVVITNVPCEDGNICVWFPTCTHVQMYPIKDLSKTGRHFDQIAEVLKEMRGEE